MAIRSNTPPDRLDKIIDNTSHSKRIESLVWIWLAQTNNFCFEQNIPFTFEFRDYFANEIERNSQIASQIRNAVQSAIIPEYYLKWMIDNHRQSLWIEHYIGMGIKSAPTQRPIIPQFETNFQTNFQMMPMSIRAPQHLNGKYRSIALFDLWVSTASISPDERISRCKSMQIAWQEHVEQSLHFSWLDGEDAEQKRAFLWRRLATMEHEITHGYACFQSQEELLIFFDNLRFTNEIRKRISQSAKRVWDQRQTRENYKDRKQCNFILSNKTISNLTKLAKKHNLSRAEIIEIVIDSESINEAYISARINRKSLLMHPAA